MATEVKNTSLGKARKAKNDEFYTQLSDIENELKHYKHHFRGKTVFCNCDDPRVSNFFHYFAYNFEYLGLKRLITTCYKNQNMNLFSREDSETGISLEYNGDKNDNRVPDPEEIGITHLEGDGDFRSPECVELLKQADIVCTNPPFSLFREYVAQLIQYNKQFLIIGNQNAITTKEIFPLIKSNKIWIGTNISPPKRFGIPEHHQPQTAPEIDENGNRFVHMGNTRWFTNLDHRKRHEELILYNPYTANAYPTYDNYDAIEVSKIVNIPKDYSGAMGVPISFIDKYNPDQFEIIGLCWLLLKEQSGPINCFYVKGKKKYRRIVIRNKEVES